MLLTMIIAGLIIYAMCWALHGFSNYLDFSAPSKEEKRYKKKVEQKFSIKGAEANKLIDIKTKNQEELHEKAMAHAKHLLANVVTEDMTKQQKDHLLNYYYQNYITKYKLSYS